VSWPAALSPALGWTLSEAPDQDSTSEVPRVVLDQRFRLIGEIGRGGMGSVHICEDLALRSRAAVKILRSHDPDLRRRFVDEATLLANLRHPHLVQVLAVGETEEGHAYMAMEYLGQSLDRRLRRGKQLDWREVVEIAGQVADALASLHRANVIHRDVKPGNIAELRGVTGRIFVKLIDLGVAQAEDVAALQQGGEQLPPRRRTQEGHVLGTPGFVPPEAGLCAPTPRFDVYGLGATIFQLCTGVTPDALDPKSMRSAKPGLDVPPELEALVERALAVVPEERIATAEEFSRQLARVRRETLAEPETALFDGCYELIELLGIGAKAEVYRAYHRDARRYVALKILRDEVLDDAEERARFDREARVLGALHHPSIPRLIDCRTGAQRQRPFIAMELRLGTRAADLGKLPGDDAEVVAEVIAVGLQLASALAAMHAKGIVHRDLNRTNVLIDGVGDPQDISASVIDLGMVELHDKFYASLDERYPTPPEARVRLGAGGLEHAAWTAPEARSGGAWTPHSDVFSLGCLLHLLLIGKRPTNDEDGQLISPAELCPESRGPLAEAILGALQPDPAYRLDAVRLGEYLTEAAEMAAEMAAAEAAEMAASKAHGDVREEHPPSALRHAQAAKQAGRESISGVRWLVLAVGVAVLCLLSWSWGRAGREHVTGGGDDGARLQAGASSGSSGEALHSVNPPPDARRTQGEADDPTGPRSEGKTTHAHRPTADLPGQGEADDPTGPRSEVKTTHAHKPTADLPGQGSLDPEHTGETPTATDDLPAKPTTRHPAPDGLREPPMTASDPPAQLTGDASSAKALRLTRAAFRAELAEHRSELDRCVRGSPAMDLRVSVAASGRTSEFRVDGASPLVELCLRDAFASIAFPVTRKGSTHRLTLGESAP